MSDSPKPHLDRNISVSDVVQPVLRKECFIVAGNRKESITWDAFVESCKVDIYNKGGCNYALSFIELVEAAKKQGDVITEELLLKLWNEADDHDVGALGKARARTVLDLFWTDYKTFREQGMLKF